MRDASGLLNNCRERTRLTVTSLLALALAGCGGLTGASIAGSQVESPPVAIGAPPPLPPPAPPVPKSLPPPPLYIPPLPPASAPAPGEITVTSDAPDLAASAPGGTHGGPKRHSAKKAAKKASIDANSASKATVGSSSQDSSSAPANGSSGGAKGKLAKTKASPHTTVTKSEARADPEVDIAPAGSVGPGLPSFPDLIPKASASTSLATSCLGIQHAGAPQLDEVSHALEGILHNAGYTELRYFAYRDGFALLTRIEVIDDAGKPAASRWDIVDPHVFKFTVKSYIDSVFKGPPRRSRFMAFIVSDSDVETSSSAPTMGVLSKTFYEGVADDLPVELKHKTLGPDTKIHVFVYEFLRPKGDLNPDASLLVVPGTISARDHLIAAALSPPLK